MGIHISNKKLKINENGDLLLTYVASRTSGEWMAVNPDPSWLVSKEIGTYFGDIKDGKFNGNGRLYLSEIYPLDEYSKISYLAKNMTFSALSIEGIFEKGKMNGRCKVYLHHDSFGSKLFMDGLFSKGNCEYAEITDDENMFYYKGRFKDYYPDGGEVTLKIEGEVYTGRLVIYELFLTDKIIDITNSNIIYEGGLDGFTRNGFGKSPSYEGYWKNNEYHGMGYCTNYRRFGNWTNGKLNGEVLLYGYYGGVYLGKFDNGRLKSLSIVKCGGKMQNFNFEKGFGFIDIDFGKDLSTRAELGIGGEITRRLNSVFVHISDIEKELANELVLMKEEFFDVELGFFLEEGRNGKLKAIKVHKTENSLKIYPPTEEVLQSLVSSYKLFKII